MKRRKGDKHRAKGKKWQKRERGGKGGKAERKRANDFSGLQVYRSQVSLPKTVSPQSISFVMTNSINHGPITIKTTRKRIILYEWDLPLSGGL